MSLPAPTGIRVTDDDFERMTVQRSRWKDRFTAEDDFGDRFFPVPYDAKVTIAYTWLCGFWFQSWGDVILARSFLDAEGHAYQIISDDHEGHYVVLTDYHGQKPTFFLTAAETKGLA